MKWALGLFLISQMAGAASICTLTATCGESEATCTAEGTEPSTSYYAGGGAVTSWSAGSCAKEEKFLRCRQIGFVEDTKTKTKGESGNTKSSFACCDAAGKAFATNVEEDAKKTCAHP